ncbi:uL15m family ribosomal protein [uncultured Methanobrevibacter sp.]|uniref:uL15m family ribosomal protein n=1 Tax=uncultured Methanobrevibacter sp. TaxID=253161 RepID=UPI0026DEA8FE|nr:uL15 family ribosomal protein [uncultured Methanobrevibacter sp.]
MIRSKRKINKQRGSRSNGGGCTKKRRGAGNKGGKGKAGASKQHWTWTVKFDPNHYGKHGFKRPSKMIKKVNPVNLVYLEEKADELIDSGKASVDGDAIVIDVTDLGFDKVLAKGNITKVFKISSPKFSASAVEKIEELGGEAIEL